MKKKFLIILCLVLFIFSVAAVSAAEDVNQTITEDTNNVVSSEDTLSVYAAEDVNQDVGDDALGVSEDVDEISAKDDGTFTALQKKINDADEGAVINLENDYVNDRDTDEWHIDITKSLTINGNGHKIDGNGLCEDSILYIGSDATNVVLKNINFINREGWLVDGGAIFSDSNNLTIVSCNFTNNSACEHGGGAIYSTGNLTVYECSFVNNTASGWEIAMGGAIYSSNFANISDSSFTNNTAEYGEAIAAIEFYINIDNCTFINNSNFFMSKFSFRDLQKIIDEADEGAVINLENDYGWRFKEEHIEITKSITIDGNGHTIDAENSRIIFYISADASNVVLKNMTFINGHTPDDGGSCIHSHSGNLTLNACNINDCHGNVWGNGAIYSSGVLTVISSNFTNNSAGEHGGAIYSSGVLTVVSSNFTNNGAHSGGAIYSLFPFDLSDSIFIRNSNDGNKRTYRDVSKSVLNDKNVVVCTNDYNILRCTLIEMGEPVNVYAPDVTKYYGGSERFVVTLKNDYGNPVANANVKITINGKSYDRTTDENGIASMAINLNSGKYNITTEYGGEKVYSTVIIKDTVIANDFTKIFKNGTQYHGTFVDSQGKLIKNTDVEININGVFYTRKTDTNGVAKMNINLPPSTYILTATNPLSGEQHTTKITVLPSIVENYDLTKYYKNASKYTLRIIGDDGKPVGEGVAVKLNINGVIYTRATNASGYMNMNINLPPGTYTVTAEYNGLRASNTINVLSTLETKDLSMKYKDGSKFEAKILDGQGRPYAGQTVNFNINGVFYQRTTGDDGIARLSINLIAGEYIITSTYNGLNAANKVTITG